MGSGVEVDTMRAFFVDTILIKEQREFCNFHPLKATIVALALKFNWSIALTTTAEAHRVAIDHADRLNYLKSRLFFLPEEFGEPFHVVHPFRNAHKHHTSAKLGLACAESYIHNGILGKSFLKFFLISSDNKIRETANYGEFNETLVH